MDDISMDANNNGDNYLVVMFSVVLSTVGYVFKTIGESLVHTVNNLDYYVLGPLEKFAVFISVCGSMVATAYQLSPRFKKWFIKKFNLG